MFCNKDYESWMADVSCVKTDIAKSRDTIKKTSISDKGVVKFVFDTPAYQVTQWIHQKPKYAAFLAIAKDNSHTVTWYEKYLDGIHRW